MSQYDPRVDAYIEKSADFAKLILNHIRQLVHQVSPLITENIKWGMPFFEYKGALCQIAAFKQHAAFGFWKQTLLDDPYKVLRIGDGAAGSFGPITKLSDLPADEILKELVEQAMRLNESGTKVAKKAPEKKELVVPDYFTEILSANPIAQATFNNFSHSHKREYIDWITEAKTEATRQKRIETSLQWLTEGKNRMWKYSK